MPPVAPWQCRTCDKTVTTPHCPDCGEPTLIARDLGLRQIALDAFHSITDLDSRLLRTFRSLLFRPGALTRAYLEGPRKPFMSPFEVFLIVNVLFFAVQSVSPTKVFSSSLASHLHDQDWSPLAQVMVENTLRASTRRSKRMRRSSIMRSA